MSLLLTAVVSAVATALGMSGEEAEKAVHFTMTAMTQIVAALKGRKQQASKPMQSETPLQPDQISPAKLDCNCAAEVPTTGRAVQSKSALTRTCQSNQI